MLPTHRDVLRDIFWKNEELGDHLPSLEVSSCSGQGIYVGAICDFAGGFEVKGDGSSEYEG